MGELSGVSALDPAPDDDPPPPTSTRSLPGPLQNSLLLALFLASLISQSSIAEADALGRVRASGRLAFGSDEEGGAPYFYRDDSNRRVGFEAELIERIARELKVEPDFHQVQWEYLLQVLGRGAIDIVLNGYELTEARARDFLATRPYYIYQLQLMARPDGPVRSWADFDLPRPGGGPWKVGVLGMSAGDLYAQRFAGPNLRIATFDGATSAMIAVRNGQIDATLQDLPAARHYVKRPEFRESLGLAGPPLGCGYYVIYTRKSDNRLRDAIDEAIGRLISSGELRAIYEKYDLWNEAQEALRGPLRSSSDRVVPARSYFDLGLLWRFGPNLLLAALTTILLSCTSMPLAMAIGLLVAIGRVYGPSLVARPLGAYVEVVRGTPLILQLYVLFYVLPEFGVTLSPWAAGVAGLAINYSAYEAEIYRAGLQAIPRGQMEAALALGMSRGQAIRRIIVPQAVRIVIPPVTSDFIALFKDTSVCSVITLTELTKQYSILFNSQGGVLEFGLATAALYMAMSLPLSRFSRWVERRLDAGPRMGVVG
ncbi:ABC transporter substrate-binding protein/permease [Tundrisphaera lichenicola]|uniref:ABC transporter substrate-binding protein/permease n=1 Tax=Tundrisphaera lichenicola TaxID=2029860 RepID=UPI003EBD28AD